MDILISSNLERLLYMISTTNKDSARQWMQQLSTAGKYDITENNLKALEVFHGEYASEEETALAIREVYEKLNYIMDTHTAVAYAAYRKYQKDNQDDHTKTVIVSTASPYKFASDVISALDKENQSLDDFELIKALSQLMQTNIPKAIKDLETLPVLHKTVCKKEEMKKQVELILGL
jgi:threonine synthase